MTYRHAGSQPVYAPNSYGGPEADPERAGAVAWDVASGELVRYAYEKHAEDDDFGQAGTLVRQVMNDDRPGPPGDQHRRPRERSCHRRDSAPGHRLLDQRRRPTRHDELPRASDATSTRTPSRRQPEWLSHVRTGRECVRPTVRWLIISSPHLAAHVCGLRADEVTTKRHACRN